MTRPELATWSLAEMQRSCQVLGHLFGGTEPVETFSHFVFVPYQGYRTDRAAAETYLAEHGNTGFFLARIDTPDCRHGHVLIGFVSDADRAAFLTTPGILAQRPDPP